MVVPPEYEIIYFQGGIYAVATDIDQKTDRELMKSEINQFLSANSLEPDPSRPELGNIITSPLARKVMGYEQMDYYFPVQAQAPDLC